jgi:lysine/ornithine N-monooxygenase
LAQHNIVEEISTAVSPLKSCPYLNILYKQEQGYKLWNVDQKYPNLFCSRTTAKYIRCSCDDLVALNFIKIEVVTQLFTCIYAHKVQKNNVNVKLVANSYFYHSVSVERTWTIGIGQQLVGLTLNKIQVEMRTCKMYFNFIF